MFYYIFVLHKVTITMTSSVLLPLHSYLRWLVLAALIFSIYRAARGYFSRRSFSKSDDAIRHWTATIAHIQFVVGMLVYLQSQLVKYFWNDFAAARANLELLFFGLIHSVLMLLAIVVLSIGSATAKRKASDVEKFKTMLVWYIVAFLIIIIAIPWPFSPLANRPLLR